MKNQTSTPSFSAKSNCSAPVSLHQLVNRLQAGLLPQAISKRSIIINDIAKTLFVSADEDILAFILGSLISNAVYSTSNCCIRVEAISREGCIQIQVKNNGVFIYSSLMHSLGHIADAARKLEGSICLQNESNSGITVGLSLVPKRAA